MNQADGIEVPRTARGKASASSSSSASGGGASSSSSASASAAGSAAVAPKIAPKSDAVQAARDLAAKLAQEDSEGEGD